MNALELKKVRDHDKAIGNICVEAKKAGMSYGQYKAMQYEKQQKLEKLKQKSSVPESQHQERPVKQIGRPKKQKPECFGECARMIRNGEMTATKAAEIMNTNVRTLRGWLKEEAAATAVDYK